MYLVFINSLNKNFRGEYLYEFLFSESTDISKPETWYATSINELADPPDPSEINKVGVLRVEDEEHALELVQNDKNFELVDAVDQIIPLGYEAREEDEEKENRLVFHFGVELTKIEDMLYKRDFHLEYTN